MNKKGLRFKNGMFAIVAISLLVIAFTVIIETQSNKYGTGIISPLGSYNKLNETSVTARGYETSLTPEDVEAGEDPEASTFRGVYGIITGMFNAFDSVTDKDDGMIANVIVQLGLPSWVHNGAITLIYIAIAFSLVEVIFRLGRVFA